MYIPFSRVMTAEVTQIIIAKILKNFVECLPNYFVLFLSILRGFPIGFSNFAMLAYGLAYMWVMTFSTSIDLLKSMVTVRRKFISFH